MFTIENPSEKDKVFIPIITALSIVIPIVVALLMYMPRSVVQTPNGAVTNFQPQFHAILNGLTAFFLIIGLYFIKAKKMVWHRTSMLSAFAMSSIFLVSYVVYHYNVPSAKFGGVGAIRGVYFFILITHILLAGTIVPLALITIYRSFTMEYSKHKKIARYTFPLWLYVAVTGVVVYLMMSPYYHSQL